MPPLFLGFVFFTVVWLLWAIVWALALLFWPVALLIAGIVVFRRQMRLWQRTSVGQDSHDARPVAPSRNGGAPPNGAFEAYREETLQRLDEEQGKFREFLQRLRRSRDKQEFDAFVAGRRGRPAITQGDTA